MDDEARSEARFGNGSWAVNVWGTTYLWPRGRAVRRMPFAAYVLLLQGLHVPCQWVWVTGFDTYADFVTWAREKEKHWSKPPLVEIIHHPRVWPEDQPQPSGQH